jgi:haloalkane dehalogenase
VSDMATVRRDYLDLAGGQLHYRTAGEKANTPLLLLHQSPSSSAMYESLMEKLARDFYLIAPDTPGFGNSDSLPGSPDSIDIADYARAIQAFTSALQITPYAVFGHHTGAAIAVQLAHDYPDTVSAVALSGPTLLTKDQKQTLPDAASPFPPTDDGAHLQAMWQRIRGKDAQAPLSLVQREVLSAFASGDAYQASYRAVTRQDFAGQLQSITCPVLAFAGDQDPLYDAVAPTLACLQHGSSIDLPGGERTYLCEQQVDVVAAALTDFFKKTGV